MICNINADFKKLHCISSRVRINYIFNTNCLPVFCCDRFIYCLGDQHLLQCLGWVVLEFLSGAFHNGPEERVHLGGEGTCVPAKGAILLSLGTCLCPHRHATTEAAGNGDFTLLERHNTHTIICIILQSVL